MIKASLFTSLIWIVCLSSCANLKIHTWYNDGTIHKELIRTDHDGNLTEEMSYVAADGYLCYSPEDDKAWRDRLALCCANSGQP